MDSSLSACKDLDRDGRAGFFSGFRLGFFLDLAIGSKDKKGLRSFHYIYQTLNQLLHENSPGKIPVIPAIPADGIHFSAGLNGIY
jgi:hypothetical protein